MSISYDKNVHVVFLVQEGSETPREATEEDFLRAGYVPASGRGNVNSPKATEFEGIKDEDCEASCEDCVFLGEDHHILIDLSSLPFVEGLLDPFKYVEGLGLNNLKDKASELFAPLFMQTPVVKVPGSEEKPVAEGFDFNVFKDFKRYTLEDILNPNAQYDPFQTTEPKVKAEPATEKKTSPVEEIAGDLFKGAFSVFNTVKDGLAELLEPVDYTVPPKSSTEDTKVTPEPAEEKPEFSEFEQTVIDKFDEMGLGADAKAAMRKSKEFTEFLSSNKPTPEQAKAFAEMLKNGKPPFFG